MTYKHIHIVACSPRSGTTLLSELFRTSFKIDGYHDFEKSIFKCRPWEYNILVSKAPTETIYFPWLLHINPNLWVVYIERDPRDVVSSKTRVKPYPYLSNLRLWKTYIRSARRAKNHARFIAIKYEDLVNKPDSVQQDLVKKIPFLEQISLFSEFGSQTQVSNMSRVALKQPRAISNASIGNWKKHLARVKSQILLHGPITQDLIDLGYESNGDWENQLENIEPDSTPSGARDIIPWHKKLRLKYRVLRKVVYYILLIKLKG